MKEINKMQLIIDSHSCNESFARSTVGAFASLLNPTLDEINDLKTAVSEAVTNCVVHAYDGVVGKITITCTLYEGAIEVVVSDNGCGIESIEKAIEPFYTTKPEGERSGMGFTVMQSFMDSCKVESNPSGGVTVVMAKVFGVKNKTKAG